MKKLFTVMFMAAGLMVATKQASAQGKIGYISTAELISAMPEYHKADTTLQQLQSALYQSAQEKQTAFYAAVDKFNKDSATYTDAVKTVKRQELARLSQELSGESDRIQQQLQQKNQELLEPIKAKALSTIQTVAKENGYTWVLEKDAVLVGPAGEDILPLVAKKLNIKLPANNAAGTSGK